MKQTLGKEKRVLVSRKPTFLHLILIQLGPEVIKIFMLNSAEHTSFPVHKC